MIKTLITAILFFSIGFGTGMWWSIPNDPSQTNSTEDASLVENETERESGTSDKEAATTTTQTEPVTTIDSSSLTEGQKTLLRSFGMDPDSIEITPSMIMCAETKIGEARVAEIANGDTPSFSEGVTLARCYTQ